MQVLQGMDPDKMIIILPTALIAMYLIVSVQKALCERHNPYIGLVLPAVCFIAATILAFRPLIVADAGEFEGLTVFCIRMWLTFNIVTLVFLFPYYRRRKYLRAAAEVAGNTDTGDAAKTEETSENEKLDADISSMETENNSLREAPLQDALQQNTGAEPSKPGKPEQSE